MNATTYPLTDTLSRKVLRAMMQWNGNLPTNVPFHTERGECWANIRGLLEHDREKFIEIRDQHCQRATELFESGKGTRQAIESACYANILQMDLNMQGGKPPVQDLPFPLSPGFLLPRWWTEGPRKPGDN